MKTLKLDDLEISKDLDRDTMSGVSGGMNLAAQGGQSAPVGAIGGGFFSPQVVTSVPVNIPIAIALDLDTALDIDNDIANVVASAYSGITQ